MEEREIEQRLAAIEQRLASLETRPAGDTEEPAAGPLDGDRFWVLHGLKQRLDDSGGITYAGAVRVADGPVEWQYGMTTDDVLQADWADVAGDLAALGSPIRLSLLQAILSGTKTVAELADSPGMGSAGQLYHHLNQLTAHGWLTSQARGTYAVPVARIVPLMVIITAAGRVM